MGSNLISIINEFASLKQIDREIIAEIIKESLESIIEKKLVPENELSINIDLENDQVVANLLTHIVENTPENFGEISINAAKKIYPSAKIGDFIPKEIPISEFGRKTIQSARQAIITRIRELETQRILGDYERQKGQIAGGVIQKVEYNGYVVDIGFASGLLPTEEQVENEYYKSGDYIKAYIVNIKRVKGKVIVILSRRRPEFINKLMESEIPEILDGDVVIKKIVREPGFRTKVVVHSENEKIDAFGCCVGKNGMRIEEIKKQLHGEQVDIVEWNNNPEKFIKNSIGNQLVKRVYLAQKGKFAQIIVDEKNKNIAIGKGGKNVRLAAKLTNYKLDVLLEEEYEEITANERRITSSIKELDGVTDKAGKALYNAGYTAVQDIHQSSVEELCRIEGVGKKTAEKIKESAKFF